MKTRSARSHLLLLKDITVAIAATLAILASVLSVPRAFAVEETVEIDLSPANIHDPVAIERKVREYFADIPVMIAIAKCESKFRQFADSGNVMRGGYQGGMVGIFQIYESVHRGAALELGMDIDTVDGNLAYARHLYNQSKTDPWISSFSCWNDKSEESGKKTSASSKKSSSKSTKLSSNLSFGMIHPEVLALQQILNAAGFTIADEGPGSKGEETEKFGSLTRDAVRRFQCENDIACSGDEYSTGYGYVGPKTRARLVETSESGIARKDDRKRSDEENENKGRAAEIEKIKAEIAKLEKRLAELESE